MVFFFFFFLTSFLGFWQLFSLFFDRYSDKDFLNKNRGLVVRIMIIMIISIRMIIRYW